MVSWFVGSFLSQQGSRAAAAAGKSVADGAAAIGNSSPIGRTLNYAANWTIPNVIPAADHIIGLYHSGYLSKDSLTAALYYQGISLENRTGDGVPWHSMWGRIVHSQRSKPNVSMVVDLYMRDLLDDKEAYARLSELGVSVRRERELMLAMESQLPEGSVVDLYQRGLISRPVADQYLRQLGYVNPENRRLILSRDTPLNMGDIDQLWTRGELTLDEYHAYLSRLGIREERDRTRLVGLTQQIPGVSDLVRFVVKDVFDPQLVADMGLDDEYEQQRQLYEFWCAAQGLGTMTLPGNPHGEPINWPQMYYRSNWDIISPTQAYQALHRLRPTGGLGGGPRDPSGAVFTASNMNAVLKAADYPQKQREWLVATSYNVLTRTDVRRMYDLGVLGSKLNDQAIDPADPISVARASPAGRELHELFQDIGYNRLDAARLAAFTIAEERTRRSKQILGQARAVVLDAYRIGMIGYDQAAVRLYRMRLDDPARLAQYNDLPFAEQLRLARLDPSVNTGLVHADFQADLAILKSHVSAVRRGFLAGLADRLGAERDLNRLGIDQARVQRYLDLWEAERRGGRKRMNVAKIQRYARYGIISPAMTEFQLRNLGYPESEITWIMSDIQREANLDLARQLERAASSDRQRRQALQRQMKEAERLRREAERRLTKLGTPSKLHRWVVRGLISPAAMRVRLLALGIAPGDADAAVADAVRDREDRLRRNRGGASNGQG